MRSFSVLVLVLAPLASCTSNTESPDPAALPASTPAPPDVPPAPAAASDAGAATIADAAVPLGPRRVAVFSGNGAGDEYVTAVEKALAGDARFVVGTFDDGGVDFGTFDVVVMPGGTASGEWTSLGAKGQRDLRGFVSGGGGYVGMCAGFYLALTETAGFIPAEHYEPWARGEGQIDVTIAAGTGVFATTGTHRLRYVNGPVIPMPSTSSPGYTVLATFAGNIGGSSLVSMKGKPAVVATRYGQGRVVGFSPHPELSGLGEMLADAVFWAAKK